MLVEAALKFHGSGCCVVPVKADGTKAPFARWKKYQAERPTDEQLRSWLSNGTYDGFGVICGTVSAGLEMFELEGRAVAEGVLADLAQSLTDHGLGELWARIAGGYVEATPSGGLHFLYRVTGQPRGNTKLASRPSTPDELAAWKTEQQANVDAEDDPEVRARRQQALDRITRGEQVPQVLVETRGEGGFVVTAPSGGRTHPSGKPWRLVTGDPDSVAAITSEERDALHAVASLLDRMPEAAPPPAPGQTGDRRDDDDTLRPGDDYNTRTDWSTILEAHGWRHTRTFGQARGWCRPGKAGLHISATTGRNAADNLYVFSTATVFEHEKPYSKFAAYALLEHGGNYADAARSLREQGYGGERPHDRVEDMIGDDHGDDQDDDQPQPSVKVAGQTHRYSDDRNALALVRDYGDQIRYCPQRGLWLNWDGSRWQWCETGGGPVREYAKQLARTLPEETKDERRYKQRSLTAVGLSGVLAFAQTDPAVVVDVAALDAHPWELNTPTGIVDLRTGDIGPADPAKMHTRTTAAAPDFDVDPTVWHNFLADTFGDDQALIAYLQRLVGYSATGYVGPHVLPFAHGSGGNGKGVFLEANTKVLGDYATTAPSKFLMAQLHAQHETEIARLAGARMVLCSEVNEGDRFDEAKVKQLTGGDTLTARFMRRDHFTFQPTHQLWLLGNSKPDVHTGGRAFWRRLRLIPFVREVPSEKIVDDLQGILAYDHGPAILAWIIRGAAAFYRDGLNEPETVKTATSEYERDQDTVARFVEECCRVGGGQHVTIKVSKVRDAYEAWCATEGEEPVNAKAFGIAVTRRFDVGRTKGSQGVRLYTNLALVGDDSDDSRPWFE